MDNTYDAQLSRLTADVTFMLSSNDGQDIFDRVCQGLSRHGFDKIVLGQAFLTKTSQNHDRLFFFQKGVTEFLAIYAEREYQFSDPVAMRTMGTHRPFRWREAHVDMTAKQTQQLEVAQSYGLRFGYVFPIIDRPGPVGFVSIGRETDFELEGMDFLEVELLTRHAYYAIHRLYGDVKSDSRIQLSTREITVLMHVANGKTNWEIGQILGISEYSVRDYLKSLSKRLETSNRTHTVVRAIQLGLFLP